MIQLPFSLPTSDRATGRRPWRLRVTGAFLVVGVSTRQVGPLPPARARLLGDAPRRPTVAARFPERTNPNGGPYA